jgi:hypothetical protein
MVGALPKVAGGTAPGPVAAARARRDKAVPQRVAGKRVVVAARAPRGRAVMLRMTRKPGARLQPPGRGPRDGIAVPARGERAAARQEASVPATPEDGAALTEAGRPGHAPAVAPARSGPVSLRMARRTAGSPQRSVPAPCGETVALTEAGGADGRAVLPTEAGTAESGGRAGQGASATLTRAGEVAAGRPAGAPVRRDGPVTPAGTGPAARSPQPGARAQCGAMTLTATAGPGRQVGIQGGRGRGTAPTAAARLAVGVPGALGGAAMMTAGVPPDAGVLRRRGRAATLAAPGKAGTGLGAGGHGRAVTVRRGARAGKATSCLAGQTAAGIRARTGARPGWKFQTR